MLIPHPRPLLEVRFVARYDRFIAEVELDGKLVDAHCVNTGRMEGLIRPGSRAWVSAVAADSPRKLRYTLELLEIGDTLIGVNTQLPNLLAEAIVRARIVPGMKRYQSLRREVRYGDNSRIDLLLMGARKDHYIEVKNCHLVYPDGGAYFPDSVSTRATGHLKELATCVDEGHRASVLFTVQRADAQFVAPSELHDPAFAAAAKGAANHGVRFTAVAFAPRLDGFHYLGTLPVRFSTKDLETMRAYQAVEADYSGWKRRSSQR